jgi:branched-subunit amino acid transport protein
MATVWLILGMGTGVYVLRLAGLVLPDAAAPPRWGRALEFLPAALLTALVVSSVAGPAGGEPAQVIAAAGAGLIMVRTGRMWACIAGGMVIYWLLRLV